MQRPKTLLLAFAVTIGAATAISAPAGAAAINAMPGAAAHAVAGHNIVQVQEAEGRESTANRRWRNDWNNRWNNYDPERRYGHRRHHRYNRHQHRHPRFVGPPPYFYYGFPFFVPPRHPPRHHWR